MYLISLNSTHHAMMLEHIIKEKGIQSLTIPTPRAITKSCGMSIKLQEEYPLQDLIQLLEDNKLSVVGVFVVEGDTLERVYTNVEGK